MLAWVERHRADLADWRTRRFGIRRVGGRARCVGKATINLVHNSPAGSKELKTWLSAAGSILCILAVLPASAQHATVSDFFSTRLPHWFPLPNVPVDNPISETKVDLGRALFYDERLSGNGTYSCGSCHQQALAFTDGLAHAIGSTGESHSRSTMTLVNVAYNASFGWNERRQSLESQMEVPMYNEHPIEMGMKRRESEVLARFNKNSRDLERFRSAFR